MLPQVEYYRQGRYEQFETILTEGSGPEAEEMYAGEDHKDARIRMLNSLAAYFVKQAVTEKGAQRKEQLTQQATDYMNKSTRIDQFVDMTWVVKGAFSS